MSLPRAVAALVLALGAAGAALAQVPVARDLFEDRRHRHGEGIAFCYNPDGMMADFEMALAEDLAAALLTEATLTPFVPWRPTPPLDYRLPFTADELYPLMAENCDALLGFAFAGEASMPDWLALSHPYLEAETVLVTSHPQYGSLEDIPSGEPIAIRALSAQDSAFLAYLQTLPEDRRWQRVPLFDNRVLLDALAAGTYAAGYVWAPSLFNATRGAPEQSGLSIIPSSLSFPPTAIGIALFSDDTFLRASLDDALAALLAEGRIDALLAAHHLARPDTN